MDTEFKVGDLVRLKSGGPDLVVTTRPAGSVGRIRVEWIDAQGAPHELTAPPACFNPAPKSEGSA